MWPSLGGRRFAVQIFGREPDALARAAGMAVDVGAAIVDINMGCPAKKVTAGRVRFGADARAGARGRAGRGGAARGPAPIPVTVKHRAGWDESSLNAAEFARALVGRGRRDDHRARPTRAQGFSGSARMEPIAAVRAGAAARDPR
jgi:tRNA-dihydrouridine synthase